MSIGVWTSEKAKDVGQKISTGNTADSLLSGVAITYFITPRPQLFGPVSFVRARPCVCLFKNIFSLGGVVGIEPENGLVESRASSAAVSPVGAVGVHVLL